MVPPSRCVVQRLLPLTQYPDSSVRRGGVVGTLRNCCFEHREWWGGGRWEVEADCAASLHWPKSLFSSQATTDGCLGPK